MIASPPPRSSSPKLLDRVRWHLRVKHYGIRTETAYLDWIRRFILFHQKRHPDDMGEEEIAAFLTSPGDSTARCRIDSKSGPKQVIVREGKGMRERSPLDAEDRPFHPPRNMIDEKMFAFKNEPSSNSR